MNERAVSIAVNASSYIPNSIPAAMAALTEMERDLQSATTYQEIQKIERGAKAIRILYGAVIAVKQRAEMVVWSCDERGLAGGWWLAVARNGCRIGRFGSAPS
jgi:hypothetical protein